MAKTKRKDTRDQMEDAYSNYDQCVEIVGCWHSWFSDVEQADFNHFPTVAISGKECTPDFLVSFDTSYRLIGEVCRLAMQGDGFRDTVGQAVGYCDYSDDTDVMMLVPHDYADQAERRMLEEGLLGTPSDSKPVVVLSYVRTDADRVTKWLFKRASQTRPISFRDGFLGPDSLHQKMTATLEGLRVPPKYWRDMKIRIPFCNDDPPPLYTACVLWEKVFGSMLSDDAYLQYGAGKVSHLLLQTTPAAVQDAARDQLEIELKLRWIRDALALLEDARLAERQDKKSEDFQVKYGRILVPGSESHETHRLILDRLHGKAKPVSLDGVPQQDALFPDTGLFSDH